MQSASESALCLCGALHTVKAAIQGVGTLHMRDAISHQQLQLGALVRRVRLVDQAAFCRELSSGWRIYTRRSPKVVVPLWRPAACLTSLTGRRDFSSAQVGVFTLGGPPKA